MASNTVSKCASETTAYVEGKIMVLVCVRPPQRGEQLDRSHVCLHPTRGLQRCSEGEDSFWELLPAPTVRHHTDPEVQI